MLDLHSMSTVAFIWAVLALLLVPGPTNTLMGVAGAAGGMRRVAGLLPAELAGYLCMVVPLAFAGGQLLAVWPGAASALKQAAALWVMVMAVALWRGGKSAAGTGAVSAQHVFITTLLNPKALVFGLVLLPPPHEAAFAPRVGLFCLMVVSAALIWGTAGHLVQAASGSERRMLLVQRVASIWLAVVSITLMASAVRG